LDEGYYGQYLRERLGGPPGTWNSLKKDSDWSLVIKLHAIMEASLNYLLVTHFKEPRLEVIFAKLDVSDQYKGKMAFVKALELLSSEDRSFIQKISEIRNSLVHNARSLDFNLKSHFKALTPEKRKEIREATVKVLLDSCQEKDPEVHRKCFDDHPRAALFFCVTGIMSRIDQTEEQRVFLRQWKKEQHESNPKES
jgi:hypothetical protein